MANRVLIRDRTIFGVFLSGMLIALVYLSSGPSQDSAGERRDARQLLTLEPWFCDVYDPAGTRVVARSVGTFHDGGTLEGRTRLEDREAGTLLLEFRYRGVWRFDDPWLTEAISDYDYLHVDDEAFSAEELAAIEAEFAEPAVSRVHALSAGQLVYGANQSLYQCHRRGQASA